MNAKKFNLPHVGMRMTKTCIAVFLCFIIDLLRGHQGMVIYSQLAVLCCIQPYVDTSLKSALERTTGTLVGAFFGMMVVLTNYYILAGFSISQNIALELLHYAIISLMLIPIIHTTLFLHQKDATNLSCVVFLSIVVGHLDDVQPYAYVWNRICDTMIGIIIGILVNTFHLPHKKRRDLLFISGLDDTLLTPHENMSSYSIIELNQMLEDGLHFTISTIRTPASLIAPLKEVHLKLPVIAMDGAVLYDINEKKYLKSYVISYAKTCELLNRIHQLGMQCFINVIIEDILVIYHKELRNDAEKELYSRLYSSPYRNYLFADLPEGSNCLYLMSVDKSENINALYHILEKDGYTEQLKILHYPSNDFIGYSYLKIYNKNATKENMITYLQAILHCSQTITFGSAEEKNDIAVPPDKPDQVVHQVKKLFMPLGLESSKKQREN